MEVQGAGTVSGEDPQQAGPSGHQSQGMPCWMKRPEWRVLSCCTAHWAIVVGAEAKWYR